MTLIEERINFRELKQQRLAIFRGETVSARYTFSNGEAPLELPEGAKASFLLIARGTNDWQRGHAAIVDKGTAVEFSILPRMTNGSNSYEWFVRITKATQVCDPETGESEERDGIIYRINGILDVKPSPGETVNPLPSPLREIDFDTVMVHNPPWATIGDIPPPQDLSGLATKKDVASVAKVAGKALSEARGKVDKAEGMGLSQNDFTDEYLEKVDLLYAKSLVTKSIAEARLQLGYSLAETLTQGIANAQNQLGA